jgi:hypothetical protein
MESREIAKIGKMGIILYSCAVGFGVGDGVIYCSGVE